MRNRMLKRTITIILCLAFLSLPDTWVMARKEISNVNGETAYSFVKTVCDIGDDTIYNAETEVSRGYFIKLAMYAANYGKDIPESTEQFFSDVPKTNQYSKFINAAHSLGIISGVGGKFYPDETITLVQAVTILSNISGYSVLAQSKGGYPTGYMQAASNYKLLKNLTNTAQDSRLDMENTMLLLYNALNARFVTTDIKGNGGYSLIEDDDVTLLSEKFDIYTVNGTVTANAFTDLISSTSGLSSGFVKVDGITYETKSSGAENYLGYNVNIYYRDDHKKEIVFCEPTNKNTLYKADIKDIEYGSSGYTIENNGKRVRLSLNSSTVPYILNGRFAAMLPSTVLAIPKGTVTFVSNDGDTNIDVILVKSYVSYVVSGVSGGENIRTTSGINIEIKSDSDDYSFEIIKDGMPATLESIEAEDVIMVAESTGAGLNKKEILVSSKKISGAVAEKGTDERGYFLKINGDKYSVDSREYSNISIGTKYTFYIDALGNIAYADKEADIVYGYLKRIKWDRREDKAILTILTEKDRWVNLAFREKVNYNGTTERASYVYNDLISAGDYKQLIRYNVNDAAEIIRFQTAQSILIGSAAESTAIARDTFRLSCEENLVWLASSLNFGGKFFVEPSSKVFVIPSDEEDIEGYRVDTEAMFERSKYYTVAAYDVGSNYTTGVLLYKKSTAAANEDSDIMIFAGKGKILDADGEASESMSGFWNGLKITVPVKVGDAGVPVADWGALSNGDLLHFEYSSQGTVISIKKIDTTVTKGTLKDKYLFGGTVKKVDTKAGHLIVSLGTSDFCTSFDNKSAVYLYEKNSKKCSIITEYDILDGDAVYIVTENLMCRQVIIIRN